MRPLTTTDVAHRPFPGAATTVQVAFSPDGTTVTFLASAPGSLVQQLFAADVATGEVVAIPTPGTVTAAEDLGAEEVLRRERARELAVGVTRYAWAATGDRVLVPMPDGPWLIDGIAAGAPVARPATSDGRAGTATDPVLDPAGSRLGYVADGEVVVVDLDDPAGDGRGLAVTSAPHDGVRNGTAEFIAMEEMGRSRGFWFSPDGALVAFCEVDESRVAPMRILHSGSDATGADAEEVHAYPFAGAANARVRVGVVPSDGTGAASPVWLDLGTTGIDADDCYVARVDWSPRGRVLVQVQDRSQRRLDLIAFDPTTGDGSLVRTERSDRWINLADDLRFLPGGRILWSHERDGFRHLCTFGTDDGEAEVAATSGEWVVTGVVAHDDEHVWFHATEATAEQRHLYRARLDGTGAPVRLTTEAGVHHCTVHPSTGTIVDRWSSRATPPRTVLRRADGTHTVLHDAADDPALAEVRLVAPEPWPVRAADGTELHAALYRPEGPGPHPTIVWLYGGPHAQLVTDSWAMTSAMRAQYLRQRGFCVAVVDGRGSAARGLAFEAALHRRMGTVEVDDQVALVDSLVAAGVADPDRIGVYGWSYGGYLSLMCAARRPDRFRAVCAGAPVVDWDGYDTHYTERYMGTPADNPDGYRDGAVTTHVTGLRGRDILLVHGLIDENVHFRHTARLQQALIAARIDTDLLLFPDERHMPRHEVDRTFLEDRVGRFFAQALGLG